MMMIRELMSYIIFIWKRRKSKMSIDDINFLIGFINLKLNLENYIKNWYFNKIYTFFEISKIENYQKIEISKVWWG